MGNMTLENGTVVVNGTGNMAGYEEHLGAASGTGAAMGAFLSLMFYPLAIMWDPRKNYRDYQTDPVLFRT